jgi:LemA protein
MKRPKNSYLIIGGIILLIFFNGCSTYNSLVNNEENVEKRVGFINSAYQSRADKTENLFNIVKNSANFEKNTLQKVIEARSAATKIQLNVDDLSEENLAKIQKAQDQFGQSLGRLMAISENYPDLKTVQGFQDFQAEYASMENEIKRERDLFNDAVIDLNKKIRRFPSNIWANIFGFEKKAYFKSSPGTENAPKIEVME